jgi:hypothetical protein
MLIASGKHEPGVRTVGGGVGVCAAVVTPATGRLPSSGREETSPEVLHIKKIKVIVEEVKEGAWTGRSSRT